MGPHSMSSIQTNQFFQIYSNDITRGIMDLDGENLPKATIQQFVKEVTKNEVRCSNEFIIAVMGLSKEYIKRVSDESNKICLEQGKKTISGEFFYQALQKLNLTSHNAELQKIEQEVVEDTSIKNQHKAKFHDSEHLKELEKQQKILFENARSENLLQFQLTEQQEEANNGDNDKTRRKINMSVFDQLDQE